MHSDTRTVLKKRLNTAGTYAFLTILMLIVLFPHGMGCGSIIHARRTDPEVARSNHTDRADARQFHRDLHHQAVSARAVLIPLAIQQPLCDDLEHLRCLAGDVNGGAMLSRACASPGKQLLFFGLGASFLVPGVMLLIPSFMLMARPGLD